MLTNVYYYNIYRPYIMGGRQNFVKKSSSASLNRLIANDQSLKNAAAKITKHTSIKHSITSYVDNIVRTVTEMRDSSKYLTTNTENYYANVLTESLEKSKEWAAEDISMFINAFNSAVSFGRSQEHSPELARYADDLSAIALQYEDTFLQAAVRVSDEGRALSFTMSELDNMSLLDFGHKIAGASKVADVMYRRTSELLRLPAQAHMDFNQLSFYYNYRIDRSADEAFRKSPNLLHSGMILDKVV